jgi:hypothetical protein
MALITGTKGGITLSTGYSTAATSWTVSVDAPVQEVTSWDDYSSGLWRKYVNGAKSWTGTITCRWDPTVSIIGALDTLVTITLNVDDSAGALALGVSGSAYLTGIQGSVDMESVAEVTFTFQGSGALATDTATT